MAKWLTLVPCYGRDYTSAEAVLAHWREGKDFRIRDISCRWDGAYMSVRDAKGEMQDTTFKIRYNKLADFCLIKKSEDEWVISDVCSEKEDW